MSTVHSLQERYVPESVEKLEESLCWLGIEFHESPSKGGPYGPYVQVEFVSTDLSLSLSLS